MCPYLETGDPECAVHHSLHKLEEAMGRCGDNYEDCPIYRQRLLSDALPDRGKAAEALGAAG